MELQAVKAADRADLISCSLAAARNVLGLLRDAELLAASGAPARACSLAALAVEEAGKAVSLTALAALPQTLRTRAPMGKMLQWHQLKQVGGLLAAAVPIDPPGLAAKLADMPEPRARQVLSALSAPADKADSLKRRGLYVDMDRNGRIREPSEITRTELASQLNHARQAATSAALLLSPAAIARITNPPAEVIDMAVAMVRSLTQAGSTRTPEAAAEIMLTAVSNLRDSKAGRVTPDSSGEARHRRTAAHRCDQPDPGGGPMA